MEPISFQFVAAGVANQVKGALYRFEPSRTGESPSWEGRDKEIKAKETGTPITDRGRWKEKYGEEYVDRYVLCELALENSKKERLVMNDAVVSVSRTKNIVTTQIVGMNGTVKEYISAGDYSVNIVVGVAAVRDGVIVDEYPAEGLRELRAFLDENEALSVHSEFLDVFDINSIVVKSFSVSQDTASNYQAVSITAESDEEYNIYSTDY